MIDPYEGNPEARVGADYAFGPVPPASLRSYGMSWVFRYLCNSPSRGLNRKLLTRAEADDLRRNGIDIVSNWQLEKNDWVGGRRAGIEFGQRARDAHYAAGGPTHATIAFSIDSDWAAVDAGRCFDYFTALNETIGDEFEVTAYGGVRTLEALRERGLVGDNCMQTASWSGGWRSNTGWPMNTRWLDWPTMRQMTVDAVRHVTIAGVSVDIDWALPGCTAFWSSATDSGDNGWDAVLAELRS